jgi:hypothetical protein
VTQAAIPNSSSPIKETVENVVRDVAPWVARVGRVGLAFRGVVYLLIGGLAAMEAVGAGGDTTGAGGALLVIVHKPFGFVLLAAATLGLLGFSLWQLLLAVPCARPRWLVPLRAGKRFACLARAVGNLGLAAIAFNVLIAGRHPAGDQSAKDWTAWLMGYPLGLWLVGGIGIGVACYGLGQIGLAFARDPAETLDLTPLRPAARTLVRLIGRFGNAARGAVFVMVGGFLVASAYHHDPNRARSLGGTMGALERQPYGPALLALAAAGLAAFGLYCLISAWYYRPHAA